MYYLVVIRERNDGGAHTQNHSRVDFTVCVCGAISDLFSTIRAEVLGKHGQHDRLLFQRVYVLNDSTGHQVLPTKR